MRSLLILVVLLALAAPAFAVGMGGIPIAGADLSPAAWSAIDGSSTSVELTLTAHPYSQVGQPDTPTSLGDFLPWAKANLGIDVPFEGDAQTLLRPKGVGVSEAVKVGTVFKVPIRAGIGWLGGTGTCVFVKTVGISF